MPPERWERAQQLYDEAQARPPASRAAFLAQACAGDAALHRDVQALLDRTISTADRLSGDHSLEPAVSLVGRRLGVYRIQALLGRGGMGEVYRAHDTRLGRDVAIKVLPTAFTDAPERLARFEREARMVAALNHPHIGAIYGFEESDDLHGLVLELVEGETLAERLARTSTSGSPGLPVGETLEYGRQIARALEAAHAKGITHRDLKPANIKLTPEGTIKLLDFGIAKMLAGEEPPADVRQPPTTSSAGTMAGAIVGTPGYMSPEQARGETVDQRADIFSFGAVLYELVTGRRAFRGPSMAAIINALLSEDPPALRDLPELDAVIRRCLQKVPEQRFPTIAAVRVALDAVSSAPVLSSQPGIAVLPFENLSPDPSGDYFGDGLAEEIINLLVQSPGLKVIARTSSFAFKGKRDDVRRIAEVLDVTHVVDGSVRKAGDRIRVTARLISARDGSHIWSNRYDRELADVFAIQDEIAHSIALTLHQELAPQIGRRPTRSLPAYDALLKSQHHMFVKLDYARSLASLEEAIALDPEFALAHASIGMHFTFMFTGQAMAAHDAAPLARRHAQRALELDPSLPEAHAVLGCIAAMYDFDWTEADRRFSLAFAHGIPSHTVRVLRANWFLVHAGRGREAVEDMERALREDPLYWGANWTLAVSYRSVGRDADADRLFLRLLGDTGAWSAIPGVVLSGNHLERGQLQEALAFAETAYERNPALPAAIGQLAGMRERMGKDGRGLLDRLQSGATFGAPMGLALYSLAIDDRDQCADWLEKAIEERDLWVSFLLNVGNIGGRVMWSSPRWPHLAQLINVDPARDLTHGKREAGS
jgi:serine/threonine protein kinase/tetratricopeptide (TPR) repeat protein